MARRTINFGRISGKSSYELAVEKGLFDGTEEEYLKREMTVFDNLRDYELEKEKIIQDIKDISCVSTGSWFVENNISSLNEVFIPVRTYLQSAIITSGLPEDEIADNAFFECKVSYLKDHTPYMIVHNVIFKRDDDTVIYSRTQLAEGNPSSLKWSPWSLWGGYDNIGNICVVEIISDINIDDLCPDENGIIIYTFNADIISSGLPFSGDGYMQVYRSGLSIHQTVTDISTNTMYIRSSNNGGNTWTSFQTGNFGIPTDCVVFIGGDEDSEEYEGNGVEYIQDADLLGGKSRSYFENLIKEAKEGSGVVAYHGPYLTKNEVGELIGVRQVVRLDYSTFKDLYDTNKLTGDIHYDVYLTEEELSILRESNRIPVLYDVLFYTKETTKDQESTEENII